MGALPEEDFRKGLAANNSARARLHPRNDSSQSPVSFLTDRTDECGKITARPANLPQCSQSIPAYFLLRLEKIFVQHMIAALGRAQSEGCNLKPRRDQRAKDIFM
jgi:hypothetical protein